MFERRKKEEKPVLAICYDFDKTLSPDDMQAQGYIQDVDFDVADFWKESNRLAEENGMDRNLAYMLMMSREAEGRLVFTKENLAEYGSRVKLFPGVETWFQRIREYGKQKGVIVEHYIISSGLKEMIEGTSVAHEFEKIYASSFYYNNRGVAVWPAQAVNFTSKTQFLFRIEKGVLDINDPKVNESFSPEEIRVPFRNIVYIGDSDTDIPCMRLVHSFGGHSIGVYNSETKDKTKVDKMMREGRIKYYVPADYSENTELDILMKSIIDKTAIYELLEGIHYQCEGESKARDRETDDEQQEKADLIIALENSLSFIQTHLIIEALTKYNYWNPDEKEALFEVAIWNSQVRYILGDKDVKRFYKKLLQGTDALSKNAKRVQEEIAKFDM